MGDCVPAWRNYLEGRNWRVQINDAGDHRGCVLGIHALNQTNQLCRVCKWMKSGMINFCCQHGDLEQKTEKLQKNLMGLNDYLPFDFSAKCKMIHIWTGEGRNSNFMLNMKSCDVTCGHLRTRACVYNSSLEMSLQCLIADKSANIQLSLIHI